MAIVGIPTAVAILAFEQPRLATVSLALLLLAAAAVGFREPAPLWHIERGWAALLAGGFAVATALLPARPLLARALLAVGIGAAVVGVAAALRPELIAGLDWHITGQFERALGRYNFEPLGGPGVDAAVRRAAAVWEAVYPGMLVLASVSALAVTAYLVARIRGEVSGLPPLGRFRFAEHLVWVLVLGLALLVLPAGAWAGRLGGNLVAAMGGLYVLRGTAVFACVVASTIRSGRIVAALGIVAVLLYPVTIGATLVVGVSDTWLDLRSRLGVVTDEE